MFARGALIFAVLAATVSAQLEIISPGGPDLWWVANSQNNIVWTCNTAPQSQSEFTILVSNSDPQVLVSPLAVVAIQQNFDCSRTLTTQQVNFTAGTGYKLTFANTINSTDVYAESQEFEIKSVGSAYPDPSATPTPGASSTASGTATGADSEETSDSNDAASVAVLSPKTFGALLAGGLAMLAL